MMTGLRAALQFLTILPLGKTKGFPAGKMAPYFPLAGLVVGLLLVVLDHVLQGYFSPAVVSFLDVLFLAVVSGALHLDGLADSADGLFSHRSSEEMLKIMKDSRVGTMGLLALIFILGMKWAGLTSIQGPRSLFLFVIPAYSRGAFTIGIQYLDYLRPEGGTGAPFFNGKRKTANLQWLLAPMVLSLFIGPKAIVLNLGFVVIVGLVLWYYKRRLGGITGDMLGALGEVTEACLFLFAGMGGG